MRREQLRAVLSRPNSVLTEPWLGTTQELLELGDRVRQHVPVTLEELTVRIVILEFGELRLDPTQGLSL